MNYNYDGYDGYEDDTDPKLPKKDEWRAEYHPVTPPPIDLEPDMTSDGDFCRPPAAAPAPALTPSAGGEPRPAVYEPEPLHPVRMFTPGPSAAPGPARRRESEKKASRGHGGGFLRAACLVLICVLLSGATTYYVVDSRLSGIDLTPVNQPVNQVVLGSTGTSGGDRTSPLAASGGTIAAQQIYQMACEQVVGVQTEAKQNGYTQQTATVVSGSGFIISSDGYIMTNHHVIEAAVQNGYTVRVILHDGGKYDATIVGYEEENDVAVLKIDASGLVPVKLGTSESMQVGETIYAVGNPLGELDYTMTDGIVSALDRTITVDSSSRQSVSINMFQISAAVNSGNSGGPVYNLNGEVIGIVSAKYKSAGIEGLGFAIPIDDAMGIAAQLIADGYVSGKPYLGISAETVSSAAAEYYNTAAGAIVRTVESGSCADKAGVKAGDTITGLGGKAVTSVEDLKLAKKPFKAGDTTQITVVRSGAELMLTITLDEEPRAQTQVRETQDAAPSYPFQLPGQGDSRWLIPNSGD